MTRYAISIVEDAKADLRRLKANDRVRVLSAIKGHLAERPGVAEGHKKILRGLKPPWTQTRPVWQLAVASCRVFYDVDEPAKEVIINAVRRKPHGKTTEEIL